MPNEHVALELTGPVHFYFVHCAHDLEGQVYATAGTVRLPSTLGLETARSLIGKDVAGTIRRMKAADRRMKLPDTTQEITVDFVYEFIPEPGETFMPGYPDYLPATTLGDILNEQMKNARNKGK